MKFLYCLALISVYVGVCFAEASDYNEIEKREHTLKKPYQGTGMTIPFWDFSGSTMITQSFIRLTPDIQSKRGLLFNKIPLRYPHWEVQIHFKVYGRGKELFGDGMAFWYVKDPMQAGNVFGHTDYFTGLGVFLDTYANQNGAHNHGHPYISAMINNGSLHYDHDRDGTHTEVAGCESKFRGAEHETILAIEYLDDVLTVSTNIDGNEKFEKCFSVNDVILPTGYFIGVSAATGDLSDNHDIISIKTFELDGKTDTSDRSIVVPKANYFAPPRDHVDDPIPPMSNVKFFFLVLFGIIGVIIIVVVGVVVFQKQQETSKKRFY